MDAFVVTGGTGFIGSNLIEHLLAVGNHVVAPVRSPHKLIPRSNLRIVDATDFDELVFNFRGCKGLFHLATDFRTGHSAQDVRSMVQSNVEFTCLIAEASHQAGIDTVVYAESASQHIEGAEYSPANLYAATKQAGSDILRFYCRLGMNMVFLSLFDTMGPNDPRGKLVNLLKTTAENGSTLQMSPGGQLVDFLFIDDVVRGLLGAMVLGSSGESDSQPICARLSSMDPVPLRQFVELVEQTIGRAINIEWGAREYREGEMFSPWLWPPVLDGWKPRVPLREGLRRTLLA